MLHHDSLVRAVARGIGKGVQPVSVVPIRLINDTYEFVPKNSATHWMWDISGGCHFPRVRELTSRKEGTQERTLHPDRPGVVCRAKSWSPVAVLTLLLHTRCRKCEVCKMHRRNEWAARAHAEFGAAPRTWFGTLTVAHDKQLANELRVRERTEARGVAWSSLTPTERFSALVAGLGSELTKALKRLRNGDKSAGRPPLSFRYLLVAEAHTGGGANTAYPHWHILIHEKGVPILKRYLKDELEVLGFSAWKLCEDKRYINYVCKYLAKDSSTRIRASIRYGSPSSGEQNDLSHSCGVDTTGGLRGDVPPGLHHHNVGTTTPTRAACGTKETMYHAATAEL